jgi:hypothetical protein
MTDNTVPATLATNGSMMDFTSVASISGLMKQLEALMKAKVSKGIPACIAFIKRIESAAALTAERFKAYAADTENLTITKFDEASREYASLHQATDGLSSIEKTDELKYIDTSDAVSLETNLDFIQSWVSQIDQKDHMGGIYGALILMSAKLTAAENEYRAFLEKFSAKSGMFKITLTGKFEKILKFDIGKYNPDKQTANVATKPSDAPPERRLTTSIRRGPLQTASGNNARMLSLGNLHGTEIFIEQNSIISTERKSYAFTGEFIVRRGRTNTIEMVVPIVLIDEHGNSMSIKVQIPIMTCYSDPYSAKHSAPFMPTSERPMETGESRFANLERDTKYNLLYPVIENDNAIAVGLSITLIAAACKAAPSMFRFPVDVMEKSINSSNPRTRISIPATTTVPIAVDASICDEAHNCNEEFKRRLLKLAEKSDTIPNGDVKPSPSPSPTGVDIRPEVTVNTGASKRKPEDEWHTQNGHGKGRFIHGKK